jgi:O-antigen ligase
MNGMSNAQAAVSASPTEVSSAGRLEQAGLVSLFGFAAALQFSIAAAQSLLAVAVLCWLALVLTRRERIEVPRFFWPLVAFAGITLVSAAFSQQPAVSFADAKQLVLFLIVPLAYRFIRGEHGSTMITVILSAGAVSAAYGIFQYAILHYDINHRARGTLGHYMTFSGLVMLVICIALARTLFGRRDRLWAALVMPALAVAVTVTFTRSATVGACVAAALLLSLKDFRLLALLPIVAAAFFALAGPDLTSRFASIFDLNNPTNRDRVAMIKEGDRMIRAHPLFGVGPNMVEARYAEFRGADAVEPINPHLHNVPVQIAAERGLPALAVWLWFVAVLLIDLVREFHGRSDRMLAAAALAAMTAALAAGMFEYNFGDSEFLMMLLLVITLPFAAARPWAPSPSHT